MSICIIVLCYKLILSDCAERACYLMFLSRNILVPHLAISYPCPLSCYHSAALFGFISFFIYMLYHMAGASGHRVDKSYQGATILTHPGVGQ